MAKITRLMKTLGFPTNDTGVCEGIAQMAERARSCNQYNVFQNRMHYLASLDEDGARLLKANIQQAQAHLKAISTAPEKSTPLTDDERILLSIDAFFFQIWAHLYPSDIQRFLNLDGPTLTHQKTSTLEAIMYDVGAGPEAAPLPFPDSYLISEGSEDDTFLKSFLETIQKSPLASGILIGTPTHTVHLFFNKGTWHMTNHDTLKDYASIDEVLRELNTLFPKPHDLQIRLFTGTIPKENKEKQSLLARCQEIADRSIDKLSPGQPYWFTKPLYRLASYVPFFRPSPRKTDNPRPLGDKRNCFDTAIKLGQEDVVRKLLSDEAMDVNSQDSGGERPLTIAAAIGYEGVVGLLVKHPRIGINYTNTRGETPLTLASSNGHVGVVKQLLEHPDITPNQKDFQGNSALILAAKKGHTEVVKLLLDHPKIDLNQTDAKGNTPLIWATLNGHTGVLEALCHRRSIAQPQQNMLLRLAASHGQVNVVQWLLEHYPNIDINESSKTGQTALGLAVASNQPSIVEHLLSTPNIDIDKADEKGLTPLYIAAVKGNDAIIKQLLTADPKISPQSDEQLNDLCETLRHVASKSSLSEGIAAMNRVLGSLNTQASESSSTMRTR